MYVCMCVCMYVCMCIHVVRKTDNVPSRLLPIRQWPRTSCAQVHELAWGHWRIGNNRKGTLSVFLTTSIDYAHLTSYSDDFR